MLQSKGDLYGLPYVSKGSYAKVFGNDHFAVKIYTDYEAYCIFSVLREGLMLSSHKIGPKFQGIVTDSHYRFKGLIMDRAVGTLANRERDAKSMLSCYRDAVGDLCYLHNRGLVHGDIKPANILVMPDGRGTLCDFGLMTFATGCGPAGTLQEELYTPMFRSPELLDLRPPYEVNFSDDIWALGLSIYTAFITVSNRHKPEEVEDLHMTILRHDPKERLALYTNRLLDVEHGPFIAELLSYCLDPNPLHRISAPKLYALMTGFANANTSPSLIQMSLLNDLMPRYCWLVANDSKAPESSASSIMICDAVAKNVWSIVHITIADDNALILSCRELFSLLKNEGWPNNKCAVITK